MPFKIAFTSAETQPAFSGAYLERLTIDFDNGRIEGYAAKCDAGGTRLKSVPVSGQLGRAALAALAAAIVPRLQADSTMPAGTVVEE